MRTAASSCLVLCGCFGVAVLAAGCLGVADPVFISTPVALSDGGAQVWPDAGPSEGPDAGSPDAGVVSAPAPDAGAVDAGRPDAGRPDAGAPAPCAQVTCQANATCTPTTGQCACSPGFVASGADCIAAAPGTPAARTQAEVCAAYTAAQHSRAGDDGFTVSTMTCDPGQVSRDALDDALARLNFYRWLVGVGPTSDTVPENDIAQHCAVVSAWNPAGPSAHFPPATSTCYTPAGAQGAGSSNIAWGAGGAASAMDLWMADYGNESTFGHRRWLLNPPLGPVGIGHYRGGNNYGSAECIRVFGGSGGGGVTPPPVVAFPPPGFSPAEYSQWVWTVQGDLPSSPTVTVTRVSDGAVLPTQYEVLNGGYGQPAAKLTRTGWSPAAGEAYHVVLAGSSGTVSYDVKPVNCP